MSEGKAMLETKADGCSNNSFCASLTPEIRARLCQGCSRRFLRAGSSISYSEIADRATLVLDGLLVNKTDSWNPQDNSPCLYTPNFAGRLLYQDTLLNVRRDYEYDYITIECLTDCRLATFKYRHVQTLYDEDPTFARKVHESAILLMYDLAKYIGVLRTSSAFAKTRAAVDLLIQWDTHLSNNGLAQLLALDRTTVSRELTNLKHREPILWKTYVGLKKHRIDVPEP